MTIKYDIPEGVALEILDGNAYQINRQDSAFYTCYDAHRVATLTYNEREYGIYCCGQMRIYYKDQIFRYSDDLISAGITDDRKLEALEKEGGEWINNSWFEVYNETDQEYTGEVYHTIKEAIEITAQQIVKEKVGA